MKVTASSNNHNRVRIIGGEWRSRILRVSPSADVRPTPDRVRETLFNWLQGPVTGARCLDLFAGSGALGLEALSRGAAAVVALELDPHAATAIRQNCEALQTTKLQLMQRSAVEWLQHNASGQRFDIVFLDPPFAAGLYATCMELLQQQQWLSPGALVYLESEQPLDQLALPANWQMIRHKRAGAVHFGLCST